MADKPKRKAAKKLSDIEKELTLPRQPNIHGQPYRQPLPPEEIEYLMRMPPKELDLHDLLIQQGKSPEHITLRDVVRSGQNLGEALGRGRDSVTELPKWSTARDRIRNTLSFTNPEYQAQFKLPDSVYGKMFEGDISLEPRYRPLPISRNTKALMRALGPQYDYPSGGPTGTTRATTDRFAKSRKAAAEKLYQDLIEGE